MLQAREGKTISCGESRTSAAPPRGPSRQVALVKPPRPSTSGDVSPAGRVGPCKAASEPGVVAAAFPVLSSVQPRHSTSPCTPTLGSPRSGPWHKYWGWGAGDPREHNEEARGEADGLGDSPLPPPRAPPAPDFSTLSCSCHQAGHPEDHQVNVSRESANRQVSVTSVMSHLWRVSTSVCGHRISWPLFSRGPQGP